MGESPEKRQSKERKRPNKSRRLLDLLCYLLNNRQPVTREQIFQNLQEHYGEGDDASERMFERDKQELLQLGIPVAYRPEDEFDEGGYTIDREKYAMPELDLAPEELAILFVAGSAALQIEGFPLAVDLRMALNKIAWKADDDALPSMSSLVWKQQPGTKPRRNKRLQQHLKRLQEAITSRKSVVISYYSFWRDEQSKRKVDPYGLGFVRGSWFLVGHCHLRNAIRVFHLDRVTALEINRLRPSEPDYEIPEGFKVQEYLATVPWQMRVHPPRRVELLLKGPSARAAAAELGQEVKLVQEGPQQIRATFDATFLDGLVPTLLSWRDRVKVLEPPEMVEKVRKALGRIAVGGDACP